MSTLSLRKSGLFILFSLFYTLIFAQELPKRTVTDTYFKKIADEGYELVDHGQFNKGELPKSIYLDLKNSHKYKVCAIPSGKLKTLAVSMGGFEMTSSKANPVFYWTHVPRKSGKTEFRFMNTKKRGRFKLSLDNSVYYIIAKKPI